jgi:hypothetical protein
MKTLSHPTSVPANSLIQKKLATVARGLRDTRLHARSARTWGALALILLTYLAVHLSTDWSLPFAFLLSCAVVFAAAIRSALAARRASLDYAEAARFVELHHPELAFALRTALEQTPQADGSLSFLQQRVVEEVLTHERGNVWTVPLRRRLRQRQRAHVATMTATFLVLGWIGWLELNASPRAARKTSAQVSTVTQLTVSPGDAEVERGSSVLITARFDGPLPTDATLAWLQAGGSKQQVSMARSLSDPVFAFTLPSVSADVSYQINYGDRSSEDFRLTIFELPALVRADASLDYPEYAGIADKRVEDTRRVSAVQGTRLEYEFLTNKPLRRAVLREADGRELELTATNAERTRFTTAFTLETSRRFTLHLEDDAGRKNSTPPDIRIEAIPNRVPVLKFVSPRGDQRVSPIEELRLRAEARDDFGLVDYGLAFSIGEGEPTFIPLRAEKPQTVQAAFGTLLALEPRKLEPGQLITWFAWADDFSPDGNVRRTQGDLFFCDVRSLDEIFREDTSGGASSAAQNNGAGEQAAELLELQGQISIGIFKLKQLSPLAPNFATDLQTLTESQAHAQALLQQVKSELEDERMKTAATEAERFMEQSAKNLESASDRGAVAPLIPAWSGSQGAYQALLRMQPREYNIANSRSRGAQQGGRRSNQRQLNQLDLKEEDQRYETETEAQAMTTPENRAQLQVLSKLRELARRQQDVNQRLQELQTALSAARDEAEKEKIRRELKRLEEEQRRLLADTDDVRQRMDEMRPGTQNQEAREQLERTREDMRRSGEELERGEVSQALASGTRARESLENLREDFRRETSSQFSEQLREARQAAREIAERQQQTQQQMDAMDKDGARSLDDSEQREEIARSLETQQAALEKLVGGLRQVTEDAESTEPKLHRQLYDLLRQQAQSDAGDRLKTSAELLRRGFVEQSKELQPDVQRDLERLRRGVERAAESVLGDESAELRFAQNELDALSRELQREHPEGESNQRGERPSTQRNAADETSGEPVAGNGEESSDRTASSRSEQSQPGDQSGEAGRQAGSAAEDETATADAGATAQTGGSGASPAQQRGGNSPQGNAPDGERRGGLATGDAGDVSRSLADALENFSGGGDVREGGPLTGDGYGEWTERLRTVEQLLDSPELRRRLTAAREQAEVLRRDYKRNSAEPTWGAVESGIVTPLAEARVLLRQEIARREQPESLQPVDRDPVPEKYAESVRKYYEALGK